MDRREETSRVVVTIDGEAHEAREGEPLVETLDRAGRPVEHLCYHPALGPLQTCDTCVVEIDGEPRRACAVRAADGLRVAVAAPRAVAARREAMDRILSRHELYCTVCDYNNGACEVHDATARMAIEHPRYPFRPKGHAVDASNPFYRYDPDQCILCGRCVEACQNLQVNETLTIDWEAERPRVLWDGGAPVDESSCVSCGHCVTVCPCNALMETSMLGEAGLFTGMPPELRRRSIELVKGLEPHTGYGPIFALSDMEARLRRADVRVTKTVCTYCGVGCAFDVWTKGRQLLKVEPRQEAPANGVSTCVKGKFGWDFVNSPQRLTRPLVRDGERFREASWEEALTRVARGLARLRDAHGPDALGFVASSKGTNEQAYLLQKLARGVIGTDNVDNDSRYCQAPATMGLWRTVGYGGDSGSIQDIAQADVVLIVGSNTAENHPVLATRVKRAQKLRGQRVIVADLRRHEMARRADLFLRPAPGTDLVWIQAVTRHILEAGLEDRAFLEARVTGLEAFRASLEGVTLERAERECGIPAAQLRAVAEEIGRAERVCVLWGMGVTQHHAGANTSTALSNLLLVTGNYGRPGTGAYPLRGHNNVQGVSDFGAITGRLPGYDRIEDDEARRRFELAWGAELPRAPGLDNTEMVEAAHDGRLKGLYVVGEEIALVDANADRVEEALRGLELLVVQEVFHSRTAQFADVVLPAAPALEEEGTYVNTERRIQRLYRAFEPLGEARPDWWILQGVARRLGADWSYDGPADVMREAAALTPLFAGVSYERLEGYRSLQWPVAADGRDTPLLYAERFPFDDGRARLVPVEGRARVDPLDESYDLHLNNGRILEHFHLGTMTYRTPGIAAKVPETFVEVSPELAAERGLETGDWVELASRRASVRLKVQVTDRVRGRELYMPMNSRAAPVNRLTSSATDPDTHTPAYKEVAVRLTRLGERGGAPLGPNQPRAHRPTPQRGVEVDRKWARSDYRFPTEPAPDGGEL